MDAAYVNRTVFCDDRGTFENAPIALPDRDFTAKRVYVCQNFERGTVRGFHYHRYEQKYFVCIRGAIKIVLLKGATSEEEALKVKPEVFVIAEGMPRALHVPADYANAWQTLTEGAILLGMSSSTVEESVKDDIRFRPEVLEGAWKVAWR